jgi:hypothetical protein
MRVLLKVVLLVFITFSGCSKKCDNTTPGITLQNSSGSSYPVRLQITDPTGAVKNTNDFVNAGTSSNELTVAKGNSTYTVTVNKNGQYEYVSRDFAFESCKRYTVNVYADRNITQVSIAVR